MVNIFEYGTTVVFAAAGVLLALFAKLSRGKKPTEQELRAKVGQLDYGVKVPAGYRAEESDVVKLPPLPEPELADQMEVDAVIVGGSWAGLASSAALQRKGISYIGFEKDPKPGLSWAKRYDRLHLHTIREVSSLPFQPMPASYPVYPSKNECARYMYDYAKNQKLKISFSSTVTSAKFDEKSNTWTVQATVKKAGSDKGRNVTVRSKVLLICTGKNPQDTPRIPAFRDLDKFRGKVMHSSVFRNGEEFRGKNVVVVGFGNSGGEIAVDLWEHDAQTTILTRGKISCMPRKFGEFLMRNPPPAFLDYGRKLPVGLFTFTFKLVQRLFYSDAHKYGLIIDNSDTAEVMKRRKHPPLIDVGTVDLIKKREISVVYGSISRFTEDGLILEDGKKLQFDACVLATGFLEKGAFEYFLDKPILQKVQALEASYEPNYYTSVLGGSGSESRAHKQLYFVGFNDFQSLINEIAREVPMMADNVEKQLAKLRA